MASLSAFLAILEVLETQLPDLIGTTAAAELQTAIAPTPTPTTEPPSPTPASNEYLR